MEVAIDAAVRPKKVFVTASARCAECHEKMYDEWKTSLHARAADSPLYVAAREDAGNETCGDRCHRPLANVLGDGDTIAREGITCDVCHTLREPKPSPKGGEFRLAIDDMVKYGPRCDLEDHYFHRMGCSTEHATAEICGGCHWWERDGIPVFTEYKDWRDGPDAKKGVVCQDCHMPGERASLAEGSPIRTGVPHHGLLGIAGDLRKRAVALEATVKAGDAGAIVIDVAVTNTTAGHTVPSGLPERRLVIRATSNVDPASDSTPIASASTAIGRFLVDDAGTPVPFWRATKVAEDTRIASGATWKHTFTLLEPGAKGTVQISVTWHAMDPVIASALSLPASTVEAHELVTLAVPFGVVTAAGRAKLPKTVRHVPPPPGKRGMQKKAKAP